MKPILRNQFAVITEQQQENIKKSLAPFFLIFILRFLRIVFRRKIYIGRNLSEESSSLGGNPSRDLCINARQDTPLGQFTTPPPHIQA